MQCSYAKYWCLKWSDIGSGRVLCSAINALWTKINCAKGSPYSYKLFIIHCRSIHSVIFLLLRWFFFSGHITSQHMMSWHEYNYGIMAWAEMRRTHAFQHQMSIFRGYFILQCIKFTEEWPGLRNLTACFRIEYVLHFKRMMLIKKESMMYYCLYFAFLFCSIAATKTMHILYGSPSNLLEDGFKLRVFVKCRYMYIYIYIYIENQYLY